LLDVVSDSKFRLKAWDLDVETTFLSRNLDEEIFMKALRGFKKDMTDTNSVVLKLK
jgi:hypothetical protein